MGTIHLVTDLADVLRAAGITVVEHAGWKSRSRPTSAGSFSAAAIMLHEDGSGRGSTPNEPAYLLAGDGPGSAKPGPLCQLWIDFQGRWHVLAAGRCNHAGVGPGWGIVPRDSGNTYCLGIETDNTEGESWSAPMRASLVPGVAALCRRYGISPAYALMGHKEYAPGRKSDPDSIHMPGLRADVAAYLASPAPHVPEGALVLMASQFETLQARLDSIEKQLGAGSLASTTGRGEAARTGWDQLRDAADVTPDEVKSIADGVLTVLAPALLDLDTRLSALQASVDALAGSGN